jgi:hypothetical protein
MGKVTKLPQVVNVARATCGPCMCASASQTGPEAASQGRSFRLDCPQAVLVAHSGLASKSQSVAQGFHHFPEHRGFQGLNYSAHIGRRKMVICSVVVLLSHIKVAEDGIWSLGAVSKDIFPKSPVWRL